MTGIEAYSRAALCLACLAIGVNACDTEPEACLPNFATVTVAVVNTTGDTLAPLNVSDTVVSTGVVLQLSPIAAGLPPEGLPEVPIFTDAFIDEVSRTGDAVVVGITAGDHTASESYRFRFDGCHVQKMTGPTTILMK
jgi:hypothetical protein